MSKRVLIILAVGFIAIIAAFFLYRHECNQAAEIYDLEPEPEQEPEPKPKRNKKTVTDEPKEETAEPAGTGTDEQPGE